MALGGRAAEALVFNSITTGAKNDLEKVTQLAYSQVRDFGFSPLVGNVSLPHTDDNMYGQRPYSDHLANTMDMEARRIVAEAYRKAENVLQENKDKLSKLAEALLERETLTYEEVEKLWGPPPYQGGSKVDPDQYEGEIIGGS